MNTNIKKFIRNIIAGLVTLMLLPIQILWVIFGIFLMMVLMIILGIISVIFWGFSFEKGINFIKNIMSPCMNYMNYMDFADGNLDIFWIIKVGKFIKGEK